MKVCLDTNVLVAAFATRGLCADVLRAVLAEHELVIGEVVLVEFRRALTRKLRLSDAAVAAAEAVFDGMELIAKPEAPSELELRDASDRWVLATAIAGDADVLVTGDDDLLAAAFDAPIDILTPRGFWELLRAHGRS